MAFLFARNRVAAGLLALAGTPLHAQDIVVTANKRPERAQDIPASLLAAAAAQLGRMQVRDFDDLVKIDPSLTISKTTQPANNSIQIRGVGTYAFSIATRPSVSVVVDDVPQAFQAQAFTELPDIATIEVLRGPQSTLYGTAATAGLIQITTAAPTASWTGGLRASVTSDAERRVSGFVSGPLAPRLLLRLAVGANQWRGNLYNLYNHTWIDGQSGLDVRGKLVWSATDTLTVTLAPHWDRSGSTCCTTASYAVSPGVTFGGFGGVAIAQKAILGSIVPGPNNRLVSEDVNPRGNASDTGGSIKAEWRPGPTTLTTITGYSDYWLHDLQDTDNTSYNWGAVVPGAAAGGSANGGWFHIRTLTQELKLTSPEARRLRFVAGFFLSHMHGQRDYVRGSNTLGQDGTLMTVPPTSSAYASYLAEAFDTNYALYGQSTFDLASLRLVTGLRINRDDIGYRLTDRVAGVSYGVPACSTASPSGLKISTCNTFNALSGRAALEYRPAAGVMLFGSYDRGYKGAAYDLTSTYTTRAPILQPGPFQNDPVADAVAAKQPIRPETVDAWQIGAKTTLARGLVWNLTAFEEVFHDFQAQSRDPVTRQNVLNSVPRVTSRGVETDLNAQITPALHLTAAGTYDDTRMNLFPGASCYPSQTPGQGCIGNQQDLSGKVLPNAPKWKFALNAVHDHGIGPDLHLALIANWTWQSRVVESLLQDPDSIQGAYGLLGLGVELHDARTSLRISCTNLTGTSYALNKGRDPNWNINPPITDAVKWTPGRDSARYLRVEIAREF